MDLKNDQKDPEQNPELVFTEFMGQFALLCSQDTIEVGLCPLGHQSGAFCSRGKAPIGQVEERCRYLREPLLLLHSKGKRCLDRILTSFVFTNKQNSALKSPIWLLFLLQC